MRKIKKHITILLLVVFTLSNIGFTYSTYCCETTAQQQNIAQKLSCCLDYKEQPTKNCCYEETISEKHFCEKECDNHCFTIYNYSKLNIDQISFAKPSLEVRVETSELITPIVFNTVETKFIKSAESIVLPRTSGKLLIISLCKSKIPSPYIS